MPNEVEPFRYQLRGGRVLVHEVVHGGTKVLLPDESFALAYFSYAEEFVGAARAATSYGRSRATT